MRGKKRKLLTPTAMSIVRAQIELGVPLARILTKADLSLSRPALAKLVEYDKMAEENPSILSSIRPEWLDHKGTSVQEQPANYNYVGFFPFGEWYAEH